MAREEVTRSTADVISLVEKDKSLVNTSCVFLLLMKALGAKLACELLPKCGCTDSISE